MALLGFRARGVRRTVAWRKWTVACVFAVCWRTCGNGPDCSAKSSSRLHFWAKYFPMMLALSWLLVHSMPSGSTRTGMELSRPCLPTRLITLHHSLSCRMPVRSRCLTWSRCLALALARHLVQSRHASLYVHWSAPFLGSSRNFRQAFRFLSTAAAHSGVHQIGSCGLVLKTLDCIKRCIPSVIHMVRSSHDNYVRVVADYCVPVSSPEEGREAGPVSPLVSPYCTSDGLVYRCSKL